MPDWAVINSLEGDELENLWQKNMAAKKLATNDSFLLNVDSQRYFHKATVDWREYKVPCPIWNSSDWCLICQGHRLGRTKEESYRATDLCTTLKEKSNMVMHWQNTYCFRAPVVTFDIPSVDVANGSSPQVVKCAFCNGVELVKEFGMRCIRCTQLSNCCWDCKSSGNACRTCSNELNNNI